MKKHSWYRASGVLSVVCALAMAGFASQAQAVTSYNLADLMSQNTVLENGDKLFSDWDFSGDTSTLSASQVTVKLIQDQNGYYGLEFGGAFFATGNTSLDFHIGFSVAVSPDAPDNLISDIHLFTDPVQISGAGSLVSVTESVYSTGPVPLTLPAVLGIGATTSENGIGLQAGGDLPQALKRVYIRKDITLIAGDGTGQITSRLQTLNHAGFSILDQTFSQIPEPGTVLLVASGIFGLCLTGRRSRK